MPTLHRYVNRPGLFVKGIMRGEPVAFRLTPEGEEYLTETLALTEGSKFAADTLKWLYGKKWVELLDFIPAEGKAPEPVAAPVAPTPPAPEPASPSPTPQPASPLPPQPSAAKSPAPPKRTPAPAKPAPPLVIPETNEVVFQGVVVVRLSALEPTILDQSATDVARSLSKTGATVLGPLPLPVLIESYTVQRDQERKTYDVRLHRRSVMVRNPRRLTREAMDDFHLPREVDVQVEMQSGK